MLKVKKQIHKKIINNVQNEQIKNQNDLNNSIKNLYIENQKKKKTIDEYVQLSTQIREKYAKLQRENNELKVTIEKYKQYLEEMQPPRRRTNYSEKPIRKRKFFKPDYEWRYDEEENEESDDGDNYITEIRQRKKNPKKRLIYDDEIDGGDEQSEPEIESDFVEEEINKAPLKKQKRN